MEFQRRSTGNELTSTTAITQPAIMYGHRQEAVKVPLATNDLDHRNGVRCLASIKRTSWSRSLSIRGRESILLEEGTKNFLSKPQGNKRPPKPRGHVKKAAQQPPDFKREKTYFQEVDAFELMEESPSPKHFGSWSKDVTMEHVHDLPAILERWKVSKLVRAHKPLFNIRSTPSMLSVPSRSSTVLTDRTPEQASLPKMHLSSLEIIRSESVDDISVSDTEKFKIPSLSGLHIEDDDLTKWSSGKLDALNTTDTTSISSALKNDPAPLSPSSSRESLGTFSQLLMLCNQSAPVSLSEALSEYCDGSSIVKLGEGTYGEAYRTGKTVCKVVPIDGDKLVNGEVQKKSEEVIEEVLLSLTLNKLRSNGDLSNKDFSCDSFIESKGFRICQGSYDAALLNAWEDWDEKNASENDHPNEFSNEQRYIVFVLADGGRDLESFIISDYNEARSLLVQVTAALAVAEKACQFEHRDLHWGNILLARDGKDSVSFILGGEPICARTFGINVSIIDFTLSRIRTGDAVLFLDLSADPALFEGPKGDKQSETYRKMKEVTGECWEGSFPKTNVLWLIYLVDIILLKKTFKRTTKDERDLRSLKKRLTLYESARDCLFDSIFNDLLLHGEAGGLQQADSA